MSPDRWMVLGDLGGGVRLLADYTSTLLWQAGDPLLAGAASFSDVPQPIGKRLNIRVNSLRMSPPRPPLSPYPIIAWFFRQLRVVGPPLNLKLAPTLGSRQDRRMRTKSWQTIPDREAIFLRRNSCFVNLKVSCSILVLGLGLVLSPPCSQTASRTYAPFNGRGYLSLALPYTFGGWRRSQGGLVVHNRSHSLLIKVLGIDDRVQR
jgi:hypothetical protein